MIDFEAYQRVLERIGSPLITDLDEVQQRYQDRLRQLQDEKDSDPLLNIGRQRPPTVQQHSQEKQNNG